MTGPPRTTDEHHEPADETREEPERPRAEDVDETYEAARMWPESWVQ